MVKRLVSGIEYGLAGVPLQPCGRDTHLRREAQVRERAIHVVERRRVDAVRGRGSEPVDHLRYVVRLRVWPATARVAPQKNGVLHHARQTAATASFTRSRHPVRAPCTAPADIRGPRVTAREVPSAHRGGCQ